MSIYLFNDTNNPVNRPMVSPYNTMGGQTLQDGFSRQDKMVFPNKFVFFCCKSSCNFVLGGENVWILLQIKNYFSFAYTQFIM